MPDFCVAARGGVVLQSGGLGHFLVLASDAAVGGGFSRVPGLEILLEGFVKTRWGGFNQDSVIKMPLHHHCCQIWNKTYSAYTLQANLFFLKLPNVRKAPNFQKRNTHIDAAHFPFCKRPFLLLPLSWKKSLIFFFSFFLANIRGEGRGAESLKSSSFNYVPLLIIFIAFL